MAANKPPARTQTPPAARTTPPKPTTLFTLFVPEDHDDDAAGPHFFEDFSHYESAPHTLIAIQEMSDAAEDADVGPLLVVYDKDLDTGRRMATVFLHDDYIELLMETMAEDADDDDTDPDLGAATDDDEDPDMADALPVPLNQTRASIGPGVPSAKAKAKGAPKTQAGETPAETTAPGKSTARATATAPSLNPAAKPAPARKQATKDAATDKPAGKASPTKKPSARK